MTIRCFITLSIRYQKQSRIHFSNIIFFFCIGVLERNPITIIIDAVTIYFDLRRINVEIRIITILLTQNSHLHRHHNWWCLHRPFHHNRCLPNPATLVLLVRYPLEHHYSPLEIQSSRLHHRHRPQCLHRPFHHNRCLRHLQSLGRWGKHQSYCRHNPPLRRIAVSIIILSTRINRTINCRLLRFSGTSSSPGAMSAL